MVNDKVSILGGGLTPSALAIAPLPTEGKIPRSWWFPAPRSLPIARPISSASASRLGAVIRIIADWAAKNGSKKVVVIQSDWAPGAEATAVFTA